MQEKAESSHERPMLEVYSGGVKQSGRRRMIDEIRIDSHGYRYAVKVPMKLLPVERGLLIALALSQDTDQTGYKLARKIDSTIEWRSKTPSKFYKALQRLEEWEYIDFAESGYPEFSENGPYRKYNFITQRGMEKLAQDHESR